MKTSERTAIADSVARCSAQLAQGDVTALARLYDAVGARLLRYSLALTRNHQDAEDALQSAMVRMAQYPEKMASARHPWAYCLCIVRNETLKVLERRRPTHALVDVGTDAVVGSREAEREESRRFVREALNRLPAEQTEVVVLKIWEQMTFQEIAIVLGESINTTASRYRYALEKLARYLRPIAEEVTCE